MAGVVAFGAVLTLYWAWIVQKQEQADRKDAFDQLAASQTERLATRIARIGDVSLEGFARFYRGDQQVSAAEFQQFTSLLTEDKSVVAWEWIEPVAPEDVARFEAEIGREGGSFQIWQRGAEGRRLRSGYALPRRASEPPRGKPIGPGV